LSEFNLYNLQFNNYILAANNKYYKPLSTLNTIIVKGGGYGSISSALGKNIHGNSGGSSGGSGWHSTTSYPTRQTRSAELKSPNQSFITNTDYIDYNNNGCTASDGTDKLSGGGGGAGGDATTINGGIGKKFNITGTEITYAGGGAGNGGSATGGEGGGGDSDTKGSNNTGGGGGSNNIGGSGIVIISYNTYTDNNQSNYIYVNLSLLDIINSKGGLGGGGDPLNNGLANTGGGGGGGLGTGGSGVVYIGFNVLNCLAGIRPYYLSSDNYKNLYTFNIYNDIDNYGDGGIGKYNISIGDSKESINSIFGNFVGDLHATNVYFGGGGAAGYNSYPKYVTANDYFAIEKISSDAYSRVIIKQDIIPNIYTGGKGGGGYSSSELIQLQHNIYKGGNDGLESTGGGGSGARDIEEPDKLVYGGDGGSGVVIIKYKWLTNSGKGTFGSGSGGTFINGEDATANTGSGGGGGGFNYHLGGNGASGIVVIKYSIEDDTNDSGFLNYIDNKWKLTQNILSNGITLNEYSQLDLTLNGSYIYEITCTNKQNAYKYDTAIPPKITINLPHDSLTGSYEAIANVILQDDGRIKTINIIEQGLGYLCKNDEVQIKIDDPPSHNADEEEPIFIVKIYKNDFDLEGKSGGLLCNSLYSKTDFTAFSTTSASDKNLKKDIKILEYNDTILHLNPVTYNWNNIIASDDLLHTGLIAQEVQELLPELVRKNLNIEGTSYNSLNYEGLIPHMIKYIQHLENQKDILEEKFK